MSIFLVKANAHKLIWNRERSHEQVGNDVWNVSLVEYCAANRSDPELPSTEELPASLQTE